MTRTIDIPAEGKSLQSIISEAIQRTLEITEDNQSKAAKLLGISHPTLAKYRKQINTRPAGPGCVTETFLRN